jgi:predicted phage-related endonuclease
MSEGKLTPNTMMSASRLPGLLGLSKYSSPNDELTLSIEALKGNEPEHKEIEAADWGNRFENQILQQSCDRLGLDSHNLSHTEAVYHPFLPLCTSLDGTADGHGLVVETDPDRGVFVVGKDSIVLDGAGVLEAKLTGQDVEDLPPMWRGPIQLQGQMACTGAKWGAVCTLYRGTKLRIFLFEMHTGTQAMIEKAVLEFQSKLDAFKANGAIDYYPPQDSKDADRVWAVGINDEPIALDDRVDVWVQEIKEAKEDMKAAIELISDREAKIKAMLKENTAGMTGRYKVKWPMRHYKAQPERITPAKPASITRQSTLNIKEI